MRCSRSALTGAVVCALLAAAPAAPAAAASPAAGTLVPANAGPTVRAGGELLVYSTYDPADHLWRLAVRRHRTTRLLAVAPSPVSFDADLGTASTGAPEVVYRRCGGDEAHPRDCELYVIRTDQGAAERPVRNANDPAHDDLTPTLWKGRLAWTREYGTAAKPNPVVYTKLLTAPRTQRSRRLPGVPTQRCAMEAGLVDPPCGPTTLRSVRALELWGDHLALIAGYVFNGLTGISQKEVRLDAVSAGTSREIAYALTGLAGQQFAGPSFHDGMLAWYKACAVPEPACRSKVGPWRYRLATGTYQQGAPGAVSVTGFADTGGQLAEVLGCTYTAAEPSAPAVCRIDGVPPPAYKTVPTPELATATPPKGH